MLLKQEFLPGSDLKKHDDLNVHFWLILMNLFTLITYHKNSKLLKSIYPKQLITTIRKPAFPRPNGNATPIFWMTKDSAIFALFANLYFLLKIFRTSLELRQRITTYEYIFLATIIQVGMCNFASYTNWNQFTLKVLR